MLCRQSMGHCRRQVQCRVLFLILRYLSFLLLFLHFWISRFLPGIISLLSRQACRAHVMAAGPLCFLSLVTVFVSPSSLKDIHFCTDSYFFSFQHCKNVMPLFWPFWLIVLPLWVTCYFSLAVTNCEHRFLWFYPIWGLLSFLVTLESFQLLFLQMLFCTALSHLLGLEWTVY